MPMFDDDKRLEQETPEERDLLLTETSAERFDRLAFARRALDLVRPVDTRVAVGAWRGRMQVEAGRNWRTPRSSARWAMLLVPESASRRAIAHAVLSLSGTPGPYALEVLVSLLAREGAARTLEPRDSSDHDGE